MKMIKSMAALVVLSLSTAMAQAIPFMSGLDDKCVGCTLSGTTAGTYVDPTGTALDGAAWIQSSTSWNDLGTYRVWEQDLNKTGTAATIDSLFVAYDDILLIKSKGVTLFDSTAYAISQPWNKVIDVVALTGDLLVAGNGRLNFYVSNIGGPTGVIWKGNTTDVAEPGTLALLGLGLAGLGFVRRKAS